MASGGNDRVKTRAYRVGKTEPTSNIAAIGPSYIEVAIARLAVIRAAVPVRNHGAFFRQGSIDAFCAFAPSALVPRTFKSFRMTFHPVEMLSKTFECTTSTENAFPLALKMAPGGLPRLDDYKAWASHAGKIRNGSSPPS